MSRINFGAKPFSYPQPVFIIASYDEYDNPNAMNAAWGGISEEQELSLCLDPYHKTTKNILRHRAFTVSMADTEHIAACDYVGLVSGNTVSDKFAKAGFTASRSCFVDAPIINELAVCIECILIDYNEASCILRGQIINVSVDENAMTNGRVDISKVRPIALDPFNHSYNIIGSPIGFVGESGKIIADL